MVEDFRALVTVENLSLRLGSKLLFKDDDPINSKHCNLEAFDWREPFKNAIESKNLNLHLPMTP